MLFLGLLECLCNSFASLRASTKRYISRREMQDERSSSIYPLYICSWLSVPITALIFFARFVASSCVARAASASLLVLVRDLFAEQIPNTREEPSSQVRLSPFHHSLYRTFVPRSCGMNRMGSACSMQRQPESSYRGRHSRSSAEVSRPRRFS